MSIRQRNFITCDYGGCPARTTVMADTTETLRDCAALYGWSTAQHECSGEIPGVEETLDYCPLHAALIDQEKS